MKNKFLNLIAFVAMALCFSTFTLAETPTNIPADISASSKTVQIKNAPTVTTASDAGSKTFISVETERQNKSTASSSITNDSNDSINNSTADNSGKLNQGNVSLWDYRLKNSRDNFYTSSARKNNFRPPSEASPAFGQSIYKSPKILKGTFDAVNKYTLRR